jgi:hypothetical protein
VTSSLGMTLSSSADVYVVFGLIMQGLVIACFYTSISSGVVKAELCPAEVRALRVGLPNAIANATFGGTAEYVALSLKSAGSRRVALDAGYADARQSRRRWSNLNGTRTALSMHETAPEEN